MRSYHHGMEELLCVGNLMRNINEELLSFDDSSISEISKLEIRDDNLENINII